MFEINWTKIKGGCQSGRKVVTHNSKSNLPLVGICFVKGLIKTWCFKIQVRHNTFIMKIVFKMILLISFDWKLYERSTESKSLHHPL